MEQWVPPADDTEPAMRSLGPSCRTRNEQSLAVRAGKLLDFLGSPPDPAPILTPRPWAGGYAPYYLTKKPRNHDGHGGYTRRNLFDRAGIPHTVRDGVPEYHPLVVARYAMRMLDVAADTGDADARRKAQVVLPALLRSAGPTGALGKGPTADTMIAAAAHANIQGIVISALLRIYEGRPDGEGSRAIEDMTRRLLAWESEGGSLSLLHDGLFLEEAPGTPMAHVLNGCLYGLFALWDLQDRLGHEEAGRVAREVERTIESTVQRYTTMSGWSLYALAAYDRSYLASAYYHALHISQVRLIALRSGSQRLLDIGARWDRALRTRSTRLTMAFAKTMQVMWLRDILRLRLDICP